MTDIMIVIAVVAAGTVVQSSVGFGLAMMAGPFLIMIDPRYLPAPMLLAALVLTIFMTFSYRREIRVRDIKPFVAGRIVGTLPGALLVGVLSATAFDILVGCCVLAAVGASVIHRNLQATPKIVFVASIISGFMSTTAAMGGPPMALAYQNMPRREMRGTLAMFFVAGCLISLVGLALVGRLALADVGRAAWLLVGIVVGMLLAGPVIGLVDRGNAKPYILATSTLAGGYVLLRGLWELSHPL
ncbi:MAG: sulfite exporter TauE/SafE family protein [Gammaproteobacteria bacterium]|nr:sulfite exporter TauE/SafE family protein [Gammaproteobacteria bacterium]